ncbi:MAG: putative head-tail joining protein [Prokaryotic dsDNA virus sp.]|jgi:SPP1 family predicted phage head-tail adaptor|nr:MAG: putative head-tail joining protein [Prokaryotic dsDNA virus sp.]|tara:strand:- start:12473 stop:13099 length:627 start_codon:yes stop_codon:yes gene_type:complete
MATTVNDIAQKAYDAVQAKITDAIQAATVGAETGRIVFDMEKAPKGYPSPTPEQRVESAYLEGFTTWPIEGDELTTSGVTYYVMATRDIVKAQGLYHVHLASEADLLWKSVTLQRAVKTSDGAGGYTEAWANLAVVDGGIAAMSGNERWNADRLNAESKWRLLIAYWGQLYATDRVLIDGRAYNISFVNDVQKRNAWTVLDLGEGVPT